MSPRWEQSPDLRRGAHVAYNLHAHLVFVTKYRRKVFTPEMLIRCEEIMGDVCADFGAKLKRFNGEHDHVHLLVHYPPKVALSKLVNSLKGVSSRYLRREFTYQVNRNIMHGRFWSGSYFAGSCGGAPLAVVKRYIQEQQRPGPVPGGWWDDSPPA
ncbi:IS200/IS605 family transposase [Allosalinactinospora lopnorensis]|uniref:IS200/IS605 family transposase n=1 Tax=Allosalinactinospora lopnorensis TaxID=1352348 RepID=UPI0009E5B996|nr:IS200/IS605 family transposase [Allosalinactinospora lopnorensis]